MDTECTVRKVRCRRRRIAVLLAALAVIAAIFAVLSANMTPAMAQLATARIKALAARAMNDAILDSMADEEQYSSLVTVLDSGTHVYMLKADTRAMNRLAAECADSALDRISEIGEQGISIPFGTITGVPFLAGKGPGIRVGFTPMGSVQSEFDSEFTSSGINQTLYRVNLRLTASIKLVMPGVSETISITAEAAIAESVLVGEVPEVYTNVASEEDMLNLIPTEVPSTP